MSDPSLEKQKNRISIAQSSDTVVRCRLVSLVHSCPWYLQIRSSHLVRMVDYANPRSLQYYCLKTIFPARDGRFQPQKMGLL